MHDLLMAVGAISSLFVVMFIILAILETKSGLALAVLLVLSSSIYFIYNTLVKVT
jgi:hypothetical protein